jgi:hypothetical protein
VVSIVKDKTDLDSWFSAKPIIVGNLSNILAGTELHLRQGVLNLIKSFSRFYRELLVKSTSYFVHIGGS